MFEARHISRWQRAGLIDAGTANRILDYEKTRQTVLWPAALAGLGILALVIGVVSLVAANWREISDTAKLAVDFVLLAAVAGMLFFAWRREFYWARELLALLLAGLILASIALVGQIYQLASPPWQPLAFWLAICTPYLFITTRSAAAGMAWVLAILLTGMLLIDHMIETRFFAERLHLHHSALLWLLTAALLLIAAALARLPAYVAQATAQQRLVTLLLLILGSLPQIIGDGILIGSHKSLQVASMTAAMLCALPCLLVLLAQKRLGLTSNHDQLMLCIGAMLAWPASTLLLPLAQDSNARMLLLGLPFIAFWLLFAHLARRSQHNGLFTLALTMVALRLFIVYLQAVGGLLVTGLGLMGGGLLFILLGYGIWRLNRQLAQRAVS